MRLNVTFSRWNMFIVLDTNTRKAQMEKRNCEIVLSVVTREYVKMLMCQIER
jgi:hypothetical protein